LLEKLLPTLAAIVVLAAIRLAVGELITRKLGGLVGHKALAHLCSALVFAGGVLYILYVWELFPVLLSVLAALGVIGVVLVFTLKDIWIANVFAGISLIGDKSIDVGIEVEIAGRRGRIEEISLTTTRVRLGDGGLMVVPNKKFREDVVVIRAKRRKRV